MKDLLKYEVFRLKRNKMFIIFAIVGAAVSLFLLLLMVAAAKMPNIVSIGVGGGDILDLEGDMSGLGGLTGVLAFIAIPSGFSSLAMFASMSVFPIMFLLIGIAGSITQEYRQGTMRNLVMSGKPREAIFFSKLIISIAVNVSFILIMAAIHFAVASLVFEVGSVDALELLRAVGLTLTAAIAISCLVVFFSFWLKNSAITIVLIAVVTYLLYAIGSMIPMLGMQIQDSAFKGVLRAIGYVIDAYPPITIQHTFNYSLDWQTALRFFLYSIGFIGVCTYVGLTLFKKKDLK